MPFERKTRHFLFYFIIPMYYIFIEKHKEFQ